MPLPVSRPMMVPEKWKSIALRTLNWPPLNLTHMACSSVVTRTSSSTLTMSEAAKNTSSTSGRLVHVISYLKLGWKSLVT